MPLNGSAQIDFKVYPGLVASHPGGNYSLLQRACLRKTETTKALLNTRLMTSVAEYSKRSILA